MEIIKVFIKFSLVGAIGAVINLLIYSLLITLNINYIMAASISFLFAMSNNFYLNFIWTFKGKAKNKSIKKKYFYFFMISLTNFIINLLVLKLMISFLSTNQFICNIIRQKFNFDHTKIVKIIAQLIGIGVATLFNFLGNFFLTFNRKEINR